MIPYAFYFLPDAIPAHIVNDRATKIVGTYGDQSFTPASRQSKRKLAFLGRIDQAVLEFLVDAANDSSQQICALFNGFVFRQGIK